MSYRPTEDPAYLAAMFGLLMLAVLSMAAYFVAGNAGVNAAAKEAKPVAFIVEERTSSNAPNVTDDTEICYTTSKDPYLLTICKDMNEMYRKKKEKKHQ